MLICHSVDINYTVISLCRSQCCYDRIQTCQDWLLLPTTIQTYWSWKHSSSEVHWVGKRRIPQSESLWINYKNIEQNFIHLYLIDLYLIDLYLIDLYSIDLYLIDLYFILRHVILCKCGNFGGQIVWHSPKMSMIERRNVSICGWCPFQRWTRSEVPLHRDNQHI